MLLPTGDVVIEDEFTTGVENYKEFFYTLVGLAGEGQNFDGNGMYVRFQTGGGAETLSLGSASANTGELFGNAIAVPLGNRPFYPGKQAAVPAEGAVLQADAAEPQRPGGRQVGADGPGRAGGQERAAAAARQAAPVRAHEGRREVTAIRKHWRDFAAIIVLLVVSLVVAVFILDNQRLSLPAGVPVLGRDFVAVEAELATAQAVTPGQGQTVNIAGVEVGEISSVKLESGRAVIGLKIEREHATIYRDASILLRPKTGLKDMVAELNPGTPEAGELAEGERIPASQTLPDVNLDEILASLDADTRDYLKLLLGDASIGLKDNGRALARTIRRFEPTARYARRVNEQLALRRHNLRRAIHNLSLLMGELGSRDTQVANFVDSSNQVFAALANQSANIQATLRELPVDARRVAEGAGQRGPDGLRARADARGPAAGGARARAVAARDAPVPDRRRRRSSATSCGRSRARRCRRCASCGPRCATWRPPRRTSRAASASSTRCSTRSPTTRPEATRRATSSGSRGRTTSARRCSPRRTRTARSATASWSSTATPRSCSRPWPAPTRRSARWSTCSTRRPARRSARTQGAPTP